MTEISQLWIYPVKSCGGVRLSTVDLTDGGLLGDRRFMLVDEGGKFLTARTEPRLLMVQVELQSHGSPLGGYLLRAPGLTPLSLPFSVEPQGHLKTTATVWKDLVEGIEVPTGTQWFEAYLGRPVRLIFQPDDALRPVNPKWARAADRVSFADGYPQLLCSESSLEDLNGRLRSPVPMTRFRPNIVVRGAPPFDEDYWAKVSLNDIPFDAPKLCERCVVTTIDGRTGESSKEPLRTLASFRRWDRAVWFGSNVIPRTMGRLEEGGVVRAIQRQNHPRTNHAKVE